MRGAANVLITHLDEMAANYFEGGGSLLSTKLSGAGNHVKHSTVNPRRDNGVSNVKPDPIAGPV